MAAAGLDASAAVGQRKDPAVPNSRRSNPTPPSKRDELTHRAFGLAASQQDADNDNDDTTLFRRPSEWVSQLSSVVGDATPEKWEELDAPFRRSAAPQQNRRPAPPAPVQARPRVPTPPVSRLPAAGPRDSLQPVQAVEGSLQRSLRPQRKRRPWLLLSLPLTAAVAALAVWNTPRAQWPYWRVELPGQAQTPAAASRGLHMPPQPEATGAVLAAPQPIAAPAPAPVVEELPPDIEPPAERESFVQEQPSERRSAHASGKRGKRGKRTERIQFSRNATPLPDSGPEDEADKPRQAAGQGTLQINSRPWAKVVVDGKFMSHTPQRALKLPAGWHRVRLINEPLGMSKSLDIEITANETSRFVEMLDEDNK